MSQIMRNLTKIKTEAPVVTLLGGKSFSRPRVLARLRLEIEDMEC
jgi:hypothetical protein